MNKTKQCPNCSGMCDEGLLNCPFCGMTLSKIEIVEEYYDFDYEKMGKGPEPIQLDMDSVWERNAERDARLGASKNTKKENLVSILLFPIIIFLIPFIPLLIIIFLIVRSVKGGVTKKTSTTSFLDTCPSCGAKNPAGTGECQYCGTIISTVVYEEESLTKDKTVMDYMYGFVDFIDSIIYPGKSKRDRKDREN